MVISWALLALLAQLQTASLHGVVTDPSSGLIPNVSVTLSGARAFSKTVQTDALGRYEFMGLPPGPYDLRASSPGFAPFERQTYEVRAGQAQNLDISLVLKAQAEQVTVAASGGSTVDTDPSNNAGALLLQSQDLDALPDDPDDLTADLLALAGPAAGPDGGQFFIDGFTGGRMPPKQSIREIRINQNPFAAQFDRPGQGRIEILTKPGSDDFHGDALFQFSDAALNSRNPFVAAKPPYQKRQWEAEVSGPIGKKTSFFADFERRDLSGNSFVNAVVLDANLNATPFTEGLVTPETGLESNLKLDRQLSTNHTLTLKYGFSRDTADNSGVGGFSLADRAYRTESYENTFQAVETAVLNLHTVSETRFRFRRQTTDQNGGTVAPAISVQDAFNSGGSPVGASFDYQNRYEAQNFTSYVNGLHTMRWGGILRGVSLEDQAMQNYSGTFTFNSLAAYRLTLLGLQDGLTAQQIRASGGGASQFSLAAGNPLAQLSQVDYGVFLQDDWRLRPWLTLSGGLRYENQTHSRDHADLAPRLGISWAVDRNSKAPKNIVRGGFGIFYDRLSESLTLNALRQNGVRQQQFLIQNPDFFPVVPSAASLSGAVQPQTIRETDAHWQAPMTLQFGIGYERQLPKHITVASNYLHTTGVHVLRSRNINAPLPGSGLRPYGGANSIYLYETSGVYRQDQWTTNVNAKVNSRLTLTGYYIYGQARSNSDGAGTFPSNQYDLSTEMGRAAFDIRHRFQLNGSVATRWGFRFSPFLTMTSGRPYNIITGTDLNGDGLFTDRPAFGPNGTFDANPKPGETIIPRNYGNGPGLVAANLRVSKTFQLGEAKNGKDSERQLVFSVNARNILNHSNYSTPDGNLSSVLFGHSTTVISGSAVGTGSSPNRLIDLQARFNF
jgi:hypothetical protein